MANALTAGNYLRDHKLFIQYYQRVSNNSNLYLKIEPKLNPSENLISSNQALPFAWSFPSLKKFLHLARAAYLLSKNNGEVSTFTDCNLRGEDTPRGFELYAVAKSSNTTGVYIASAYVNKHKRQIIVSHGDVSQSSESACSAMTFAFEIVKQVELLEGWSVFFTGFFRGGWLAQITCFSTLFLTITEDNFFAAQKPHKRICPYTVAFHAPCAATDFLEKVRDELFTQEFVAANALNWCLPIEIFILESCTSLRQQVFHSDFGTVFLIKEREYNNKWSQSDIVEEIRDLMYDSDESDVIIGETLIDNFVDDSTKNQRINSSSSRFIATRFLTLEEIDFVKRVQYSYLEGQFEGTHFYDEVVANKIVHKFRWNLSLRGEDNGIVLECSDIKSQTLIPRQQVIPRIKYVVSCLQAGRLWWNPKERRLPDVLIERVWKTTSSDINYPYSEYFTKKTFAKNIEDKEVLLDDLPGMGKSVALTELEIILRKTKSNPRIVCKVNMNDILRNLRNTPKGNELTVFDIFSCLLPFQSVKEALSEEKVSQKTSVYFLIDALDSISLQDTAHMNRVIELLLEEKQNKQSLHFVIKTIVFATRTASVKILNGNEFEAFSLRSLIRCDQEKFLVKKLKDEGCLISLRRDIKEVPFLNELLSNPLLLTTYAEFLQCGKVLDSESILILYLHFLEALHYLYFMGMGGTHTLDQLARKRAVVSAEVNISYYYYFALNEFFRESCDLESLSDSLRILSKRKPDKECLEELSSFGVLVSNDEGGHAFTYPTFNQFILTKLFIEEKKPFTFKNNLTKAVALWEQKSKLEFIKYALKNEQYFLDEIEMMVSQQDPVLLATKRKESQFKGLLISHTTKTELTPVTVESHNTSDSFKSFPSCKRVPHVSGNPDLPKPKQNLQRALDQMSSTTEKYWTHSDPKFVEFFQYYLNCPIYLVMDYETDFCLRIKPKTWALSILYSYENNMTELVKTLAEAIFSNDDLLFRESGFHEFHIFETSLHRKQYDRKKKVIMGAAYWLWTQVGFEINLLRHVPMKENEILNIPAALMKEIEKGLSSYIPLEDEESENLPLMSVGVSELERRSRIYKHPLKNDMLMHHLSDNFEAILKGETLTMKAMFETLVGLLLTRQTLALQQIINKNTFEDEVDILQFLTYTTFGSYEGYTDVLFGPLQVPVASLVVLEKQRSSGIAEITRSLVQMVFQRYNGQNDPQNPNSSFKPLKTDKSAAVLLVSVMAAAKCISALPEETGLVDWFEAKNIDTTFYRFPLRSEYEVIRQTLQEFWGGIFLVNPKFKSFRQGQSYARKEEQDLSRRPLPLSEEYCKLYCKLDYNGLKYVTFEESDKDPVCFNLTTLQEAYTIMKETSNKLKESNDSLSSREAGFLKSPGGSRKISLEYQAGKYLLHKVFEEKVLNMKRATKDSPEGLALTRVKEPLLIHNRFMCWLITTDVIDDLTGMLKCLKTEVTLSPDAIDCQFITEAQKTPSEGSIRVRCDSDLDVDSISLLFTEIPSQQRHKEKHPLNVHRSK